MLCEKVEKLGFVGEVEKWAWVEGRTVVFGGSMMRFWVGLVVFRMWMLMVG